MSNETHIVGEVNQAGREALTNWLREVLSEPFYATEFATKFINELDGSDAEVCGLSVEISGLKTASGNPETYRFESGEYDLVTYVDGERVG